MRECVQAVGPTQTITNANKSQSLYALPYVRGGLGYVAHCSLEFWYMGWVLRSATSKLDLFDRLHKVSHYKQGCEPRI